ncbi:MAG TPA: histidine kinase [Pseudonocardia sp.]|jgi:hypothetical protein
MTTRPPDSDRDPSGERLRHTEARRWRHRRKLERRLHDGASLRLSAMSLRLGLLTEQGPGELPERVGELQDELHAVLQELRAVANGIYPPLLDEAGLAPALRELADRLGLRLAVVSTDERFGAVLEGASYTALAEYLDPEYRDADDPEPEEEPLVGVDIRREDDALVLAVVGGGHRCAVLIRDQVGPLGGLVTEEPTGQIIVRVPCE